jgi:basic amino acid/polyamine antiporter, APA family
MHDVGTARVEEKTPEVVQPHLGLWDTVSIIVGIVIGAGIYETAPFIFQNVPNAWVGLGVWVLGGVLTLIGGLCYAELASTYPRSGGDYVYLTKAYGSWAGFLFGWTQLAVLMTGSMGMMAYIFADYAARLWRFGPASEFIYASGAVLLLSFANLAGLVFGRRTQNLLTALKVVALTSLVVAGFIWGAPVHALPAGATSGGSIGLAMILVLYTYGGWNDAALVAAEITEKKRNLPLAFILGTGVLMFVYVLVNAAYLSALDFEGARRSKAIAAEVLHQPFGEFGAKAMALFVMVSALGSLNGMTFTGSRIYSTLGQDYPLFHALASWNRRRGVPVISLITQTIVTLILIWLVGTNSGRHVIDVAVSAMGLHLTRWEGHGGFDTLLRCTAPVFWTFFLMTGTSLFILRLRDRGALRPFKVPLYPAIPAIFCAMCAYMLYSAWDYAGTLLVIGLVPIIMGVILYWVTGRRRLQK